MIEYFPMPHLVMKKVNELTVYVHVNSYGPLRIGSWPPIAHGLRGCLDTVPPKPICVTSEGRLTLAPNYGYYSCDPIPTDDTADGATVASDCLVSLDFLRIGSVLDLVMSWVFHCSHNTGGL